VDAKPRAPEIWDRPAAEVRSLMLKPIAALSLLVTAFLSAAISQTNSTTNDRDFQVAAYTRVRVAKPAAAVASIEKQAFDLINKKRSDAGLEPLVWSDELAEVARLHSEDMAGQKFFSHRGSDGSMVDDRADKLGIRNWSAIGENIAFERGFDDAASFAVDRWMESAAHKQNLLDKRWKETGMGVAILPDGTFYFTQVFLLRD
jgi:uncharacterized protein YkwD